MILVEMMKRMILWIAGIGLLTGCAVKTREESFTAKVDPLIGTGEHGHVFVGASVPFGMVQVGPTSVSQGWDWCSGYHQSDSTVIGFSHTHLSGTGCGDLLDITLMPVTGTNLTYDRGTTDSIGSGLWSYADRKEEITRPGYYSVPLTRYGILAEMTSTSRVGLHRYTFPDSKEAAVVFDLLNGGNWDRPTDVHMEVAGNSRIQGWRHSTGWADNQKVYFVADFSRPFKKFELKDEDGLFGRADFDATSSEPLLVKVALSPVSIEGAAANMEAELPGWDFEGTAEAADRAWDNELRKVRIEGATPEEEKIFYTSLYHSMIAPSEFCDVNGDYRRADGKAEKGNHTTYTTYSLWDTYRAAMPLLSITQPDRYADMINTMTDICEQQGRLPVWHLWGCETDCMVGNPALPVVADAIVKDIPGVDKERAYKAILTTAMDTTRGNGLRQKYGYIPFDLYPKESVAYDMEYALADGAVAEAARAMGDTASYNYFTERSHSYRNYFDPSTGLMRGKDSRGNFRVPFNPFYASHRDNDYCEGTAWQYTWLAPHDIEGLRDCFGSDEKMLSKLDSLFTASSRLEGEDVSPDVSGLIGQYAHGNEPGHHTAYIYTMLGYPDKTADKVREILTTMYTTEADGICGNEDVGQMSAWYVLSALGIYETEPGSGRYWLGYPLFEKAEIDVPGGTFRIIAEKDDPKRQHYIDSAELNGKKLQERYIHYSDIMRGGELRLLMK